MQLVFISHAHRDHEKAGALDGRLRRAGFETFLDEDIEFARAWRLEVQQALDSAAVVVVVCTPDSMASREVWFELAYAMGRGTPVVPLVYERSLQLPSFLADIQVVQHAGGRDWGGIINRLTSRPEPRQIAEKCREIGLIDIGRGREESDRSAYIYNVLNSAKRGTTVIVVGRSLIDWALLELEISRKISEKALHIKLALLDENSINTSSHSRRHGGRNSWIEPPIEADWAMADVPQSMARFRRIRVTAHTGSVTLYGLPFYPSHSFVAFTKESDGRRYYLQEAGMASPKGRRPFLELCELASDGQDSFGSVLEWVNEGLMTEERLLLFDDGTKRVTRDTTHFGKMISDKVGSMGLVDISVGRNNLDWCRDDISARINNIPDGGEIFMVGRSMVSWAKHHQQLADAIVLRGVRCTFVMADPTQPTLRSLAEDDWAEADVPTCWELFQRIPPLIVSRANANSGYFEIYGIPAYIPETFASYTGPGGVPFCTLEPGIAADPEKRPIMFFTKVSDLDVYTHLDTIFRGILKKRRPLLRSPEY